VMPRVFTSKLVQPSSCAQTDIVSGFWGLRGAIEAKCDLPAGKALPPGDRCPIATFRQAQVVDGEHSFDRSTSRWMRSGGAARRPRTPPGSELSAGTIVRLIVH
jgi:hypothetical protein